TPAARSAETTSTTGSVPQYAAGPPASTGSSASDRPALSGAVSVTRLSATRSTVTRSRPFAWPSATTAAGCVSAIAAESARVASPYTTGSTTVATSRSAARREANSASAAADELTGRPSKGSKAETRTRPESASQRVDDGRLAVGREQQQVDHPERVRVRPELGPPGRVADDRERAPLHGPVERLGHDARADAGQSALVQLRLAQDVEPERRVGRHPLELLLRQPLEGRRALAVADLRPGQRRHRDAPALHQRRHLLARGERDHLRPCQVAVGQVPVDARRRRRAPDRAGGQVVQRVHELRVDALRPVEVRLLHDQVLAAGLAE